MVAEKDLSKRINDADIPKLLKDYLLRNQNIQLSINSNLLKDIEELYVEYDSLYDFDKAEFSAHVITGIKKQDKHDFFYNYLKIVIESNLRLISKSKVINYEVLKRMSENISHLKEDIPESIKIIYNIIEDYKKDKDFSLLFIAYKISGQLDILLTIYPGHPNSNDFKKANNLLKEIIIET